ncbi:hypothetical protein DFAR_1540020 [Desulfarculales bacterium]
MGASGFGGTASIWLRCFRCPDCRAVIRLRPRGYWSRFQALVEIIRQSLSNKLARGRWDPDLPRSRQRHWLQGLLRQVSLYLGLSWSGDLLGAFDWLNGRGPPVGAKREPFPSLSHLPKGAVVLARPPGLHMGETPPWRTDMDEDQKKRVAIFRFGVISDFFASDGMERSERKRLLRDKCAQRWQIPFSSRTRLSRSIILGWVSLYRQGDGKLTSLYPMGRNDRGGSRALDEDTDQTLVRLRRKLPTASVITLISKMMR